MMILMHLYLYSQNGLMHNSQIDSVLIHYVDFELMTISDIDCDEFESLLSLNYKKSILITPIHIAEFKDLFLMKKNKTKQPIDVRCKKYIYTPEKIKVACLGQHVLWDGDTFYSVNNSFIDRMKKLISKGKIPESDTIINNKPILLTGQDIFYNYIRQSCLPIMEKEKIDSLKVLIDFYIDREGNSIDITIKKWNRYPIPVSLQKEIIQLFHEKIKWSPSKDRPSKFRKILPIVITPD